MDKQPNIVLLLMDCARAANLSSYGYQRRTTPNIDSIADQGALYEQAISVGCWTLPVHASLFTGLYPHSHGLTLSRHALPDPFQTLARQLRAAGYQTACFSNNAYISEATGLAQGFEVMESVWRMTNPRGTQRTAASKLLRKLETQGPAARPVIRLIRVLQHVRSVTKQLSRKTDKGAQATNRRIQTWLTKRRNPAAPFFIFVNYMECHQPYRPPTPYNRRYVSKRFSPWRVARLEHLDLAGRRLEAKRHEEDLEILRCLYDGEQSYLDERIGELVRFLEAQGLLNETFLVITSDHGESLGEHGFFGHRLALYDHLVHIPLIVRYPPFAAARTRVRKQVQILDLYKTFLELAGVRPGEVALPGAFTLMELANGAAHPFTVAENTGPKSKDNVIERMMRTEEYKFIWKSNGQHELYHLAHDPEELVNMVTVQPERVRQMNAQLDEWQRALANHQIETSEVEYDRVVSERLRDLGYVD